METKLVSMHWIAAVRLHLRDKETLHHPKYLCQADPVFKWPRVAARGGPLEDTLTALWRVLQGGTQGRRVHSVVVECSGGKERW